MLSRKQQNVKQLSSEDWEKINQYIDSRVESRVESELISKIEDELERCFKKAVIDLFKSKLGSELDYQFDLRSYINNFSSKKKNREVIDFYRWFNNQLHAYIDKELSARMVKQKYNDKFIKQVAQEINAYQLNGK
jgi:uncharacterized membrane protein YheB (UPF0754 family)